MNAKQIRKELLNGVKNAGDNEYVTVRRDQLLIALSDEAQPATDSTDTTEDESQKPKSGRKKTETA